MRAISSAASISIHAAVAAAFLLGTTNPGRSDPAPEHPFIIDFPPPSDRNAESGIGFGTLTPDVRPVVDLGSIPLPSSLLPGEALTTSVFPTGWVPSSGPGVDHATAWAAGSAESAPEVLSGPLPLYPDLLRQAGVEGQVVLEARVDTTGWVQRASVSVVSATHPGFVEPARQALLATLFRPARVNGRAVATLVRVPFAFSIRGGTGRAR